MTRLLLLRHAESEWNAQGRWQGIADPPLSPRGEEQATLAGQLLRPVGLTAVVSSDLRRARATAERIARELPVRGPLGVEAGLREYDLGAWSGLNRAEIEQRWPGEIDEWRQGVLFATPGGERRDEFVVRIAAAVARVASRWPEDTVLVITHGGVISALVRSLGAPPRRFTHLAGLWIDADEGRLRPGTEVSLLAPGRPGSDQGEASELSATAAGVIDTGDR